MKHTKGNWSTDKDSVYSEGLGIEGNIICEAPIYWEISMQNWEANAKLIACAPEMLEQLKLLYSFYEELAMKINSDDFDEEFRSKWNPIMSNTEQLINKATTL